MAGFDTRNALNLAIRALTDSAIKRAAGGWIPPKERERQQRDAMRQEQQQARQAEKEQKEAVRAEEKQQKLLSKQFPTQYMPNVGRQVMAEGGDADRDDLASGGKVKKHPALSISGTHIREETHGEPIFTGRL